MRCEEIDSPESQHCEEEGLVQTPQSDSPKLAFEVTDAVGGGVEGHTESCEVSECPSEKGNVTAESSEPLGESDGCGASKKRPRKGKEETFPLKMIKLQVALWILGATIFAHFFGKGLFLK